MLDVLSHQGDSSQSHHSMPPQLPWDGRAKAVVTVAGGCGVAPRKAARHSSQGPVPRWVPEVSKRVHTKPRPQLPRPVWLGGLGAILQSGGIAGSTPGQGTGLSCRFGPQLGPEREATDRRFSPSLSPSLPFFLKINK